MLAEQSKNSQSQVIIQVVSLTIQMLGWVSLALLLIVLVDLLWPSMEIRPYLRFACHQNPSRCLLIDGHPLALCARCLRRVCGISLLAAGPEAESAFFTPLDPHRRG